MRNHTKDENRTCPTSSSSSAEEEEIDVLDIFSQGSGQSREFKRLLTSLKSAYLRRRRGFIEWVFVACEVLLWHKTLAQKPKSLCFLDLPSNFQCR